MSALEIVSKWALVFMLGYGTLLSVARVGKPGTSTSGGVAAGIVLINAAFITAIIVYWD